MLGAAAVLSIQGAKMDGKDFFGHCCIFLCFIMLGLIATLIYFGVKGFSGVSPFAFLGAWFIGTLASAFGTAGLLAMVCAGACLYQLAVSTKNCVVANIPDCQLDDCATSSCTILRTLKSCGDQMIEHCCPSTSTDTHNSYVPILSHHQRSQGTPTVAEVLNVQQQSPGSKYSPV